MQKFPPNVSENNIEEIIRTTKAKLNALRDQISPIAQARNVPFYTKLKVAPNVESAIYKEINSPNVVRMVLLGWPSQDEKNQNTA